MKTRSLSFSQILRSLALTLVVLASIRLLTAYAQGLAPQPDIAVQAAAQGHPWINLQDGAALPALEAAQAQPLSLAADDFDEDGVPDLVSGYADAAGRGLLTLHRGNLDAIYPNSSEAQARKAEGTFTDAAFLTPARVFDAPIAPDVVAAGDFDNDGHQDVVAAAYGQAALVLLPGDGQGGLGAAERIALPGGVTALTTGDLNWRDGITDLVVGVEGAAGAQVLIFEGPQGALRSQPQAVALPAAATGLAVGQLDDHFAIDLAIAAGKTLHIVHGRVSRREPLTIKQHTFEYPIIDVAIGDFLLEDGYQLELAALADDGAVHIIDAGIGMTLMQQPVLSGLQASHASRTVSTPRLTTVNLSSLPTDDLLILDPPSRQAQILVTSVRGAAATEVESHPWLAALGAEYAPVAALPMRLSVDALSDLVLLGDGPNPLSFAITAPLHTFTVNDPDFVSDCNPGDGVCETAPGNGVCTFWAALSEANYSPGLDTIEFNLGGGGVQTTRVGTGAVDPVVIDGTTQPGFDGEPLIVISNRLYVEGDSTVRGLILSGELNSGVSVDGSNSIVEGNWIGTDHTGTGANAGEYSGMGIGGDNNTIGGSAGQARNLMSGNSKGLIIVDGTGNVVRGNYIGTDKTGTARLGNFHAGVSIYSTSNNNTVSGNLISGNEQYGVDLSSGEGNLIQSNKIGVDVQDAATLGNGLSGVRIMNVLSYNTIGGAAAGAGNMIAGNYRHGVLVTAYLWDPLKATTNRISRNSIFRNGGQGIDLSSNAEGDYLTNPPLPNDPGDPDWGPNYQQNWPEFSAAVMEDDNIIVTFKVDSAPENSAYPLEIEFYLADDGTPSPEGKTFLGSMTYVTATAQSVVSTTLSIAAFDVGVEDPIVATATDADGNTSEFSEPILLNVQNPVVVNSTGDEADADPGDGVCETAAGNSTCTLRAAIETVNAGVGAGAIQFDIPGGGVPVIQPQGALPVITQQLLIDGNTQPNAAQVELDGSAAGAGVYGLAATGSGELAIKGLNVHHFSSHGILGFDASISIRGTGSEIHHNGGWGIRTEAAGYIEVYTDAMTSVHHNDEGGISSINALALPPGFISEYNGGPGIVTFGGSGVLTLEDVKSRHNGGDGIGALNTSLIIQGDDTQIIHNGGHGIFALFESVTLQGTGIELHDNGGWGIFSKGFVDIAEGALTRVYNNQKGGIFGCLNLSPGLTVEHNGGPGIVNIYGSESDLVLEDIVVRFNQGNGVESIDRPIIIQGTANEIVNNAGDGIRVFLQGVEIKGATNLHDNGGWGIQADAGITIDTGAMSSANGNGKGGLFTQGVLKLPSGFAVEYNGGPGIIALGVNSSELDQLELENVTVRFNKGVGVGSSSMPIVLSGESTIAYNDGHGVQNYWSPIFIEGAQTTIRDNGGWGVWNETGAIIVRTRVTIQRNGKGGIFSEGDIEASNLRVDNNTGPGVAGAGGYVRLANARITNNIGHGVDILSAPLLIEGNFNQISGNHGWGIHASYGGIYLENVYVSTNRGGGIWAQNSRIQGERGSINGNQGDGIVALFTPVVWNNGDVGYNQGWGLVVTSPPSLSLTRIHDNANGGIHYPIANSSLMGVAANEPQTGLITRSSINTNSGDGLFIEAEGITLTLSASNLYGNSGYAVDNQAASSVVSAPGNWWGDPAGPGSTITGNVEAGNWLTRPITLTLAASADPLIAAPGAAVSNTIHVRNWAHPTDTITVTLGDTEGWLLAPFTVTAELTPTFGASFPVSVSVPGGAALGSSDTVTVTVVSGSDLTATDIITYQVMVAQVADLALAQFTAPSQPLSGHPLTTTLVIANDGPNDATGVTLTDTLPISASLSSASATQGTCAENNHVVVCEIGAISSTAEVSVTIVLIPDAYGILENRANVGGSEHDPDVFNNQSVSFAVVDIANLSLHKTTSAFTTTIENPLTYTLVLANDGPADATGVVLSDTLPLSVTLDTVSTTAGNCLTVGSTVTCNIASILAEGRVTVTLVTIPIATGTITNTASVAGLQPDADYDNSDFVRVAVIPIIWYKTYLPLIMR